MTVWVVPISIEISEIVVTPAGQDFSALAQASGGVAAGLGFAAVLACLFGLDPQAIGLVGLQCFVGWFVESWWTFLEVESKSERPAMDPGTL